MGQSYCYSITLPYTSSNLHIFFGPCEECEKPIWVWAILDEAQLDIFKHAPCYWASWWAWAWWALAWCACRPWIGPWAWFGPRRCLSYKPCWDDISPVHVVPKKSGITVVKNEKNELIPTRIQNSWKVCIDYRRQNQATRKDHFRYHSWTKC